MPSGRHRDSDLDRPTIPAPEPPLRAISMKLPIGTHAAQFGAGASVDPEDFSELVWGCTTEGLFDYLGPQWFAYTGIPAEEQLGRSLAELLHPSDRERAQQSFCDASGAANAFEIDARVRRRDGVFRWFRLRARAAYTNTGALRFCGVGCDVEDLYQSKQDVRVLSHALAARIGERTDQLLRESQRRERVEGELTRLRARFVNATEAGPIGVWEWSLCDAAPEWDDSLYALYGLDRVCAGEPAQAWRACLHREDVERAEREIIRLLAADGGGDSQTGFRVVGADGATRHIRSSAQVERDAEGRALRLIGTNWDETTQVESERLLREQNRKLARSNAELEQFAYAASHDLQEPLRAVAGSARLLGRRYRGQLDPDADAILENLVDGAERMRRLIKDILALSRISSRGAPFATFSAERPLSAALRNLRVAIVTSGAEIIHDRLPPVRGDKSQLTSLFQNLIGNAIKYRSERPPRVQIRAEPSGRDVRFAIQDNGIGIDRADFERVFGLFQRLHTRATHPGSGIGLALCKKIVERHGGQIWVESSLGEGSTFYFSLAADGGEDEAAGGATRG
ncbi:MAG TPA: ATP-binding protein [Polyangiales bacterium]|jgi:PAS domain S-box-containing protein